MKLLHTGDLHIGKVVNEMSMLEDQRFALKSIVDIAIRENVDGVILAGDLYDRSVPPAEAVVVLNDFLTELVDKGIKVYAIAGNHDSPERINFVSSILSKNGISISGMFDGRVMKDRFHDEFGDVNIYLLPFTKPSYVKNYYEVSEDSADEAMRCIINDMNIDETKRNIMITHNFVINGDEEPITSDSETRLYVGGAENVDASCFDKFDYTALGHIHRACRLGKNNVYYAGSPIKYSFSETSHIKSVYIVELLEKGRVDVQKIELPIYHDMRKIIGELHNLISDEVVNAFNNEDYIWAVLTDSAELIEPMSVLRNRYPNIMQVTIEKKQKELKESAKREYGVKSKSPEELYLEFYEFVTCRELSDEHVTVISEIVEEAEGVRR